jgi:DNA-binding NtrC family response regulator
MTEVDGRNKIIIADDESSIRKIVGIMIGQSIPGFEIEFFEDGTSLENKLNDGIANVRLVITDNHMPGVSGSELIRRYAPQLKERKIPMILYYGGEETIGREAVRNGAFAYLLKPCDLSTFTRKITEALNCHNYQSED